MNSVLRVQHLGPSGTHETKSMRQNTTKTQINLHKVDKQANTKENWGYIFICRCEINGGTGNLETQDSCFDNKTVEIKDN